MRLIDADKFKEYVRGAFEDNADRFKTDLYKEIARNVTQGMLEDIDEQPTAYDVGKVVERLEELKDAPKLDTRYNNGWTASAECAIEIVRKGGSNE